MDASQKRQAPDALHERITKYRADQAARLARILSTPVDPVPTVGLAQTIAAMEQSVTVDQAVWRWKFFTASGRPFGSIKPWNAKPIIDEWWHSVTVWSDAMDARRTELSERNGLSERTALAELAVFEEALLGHKQELRDALAKQWNDAHPLLPGAWDEAGAEFVAEYVAEEK